MDRVNHIRRKTIIAGSAVATALFLAIAAPAAAADSGTVMLTAAAQTAPAGTTNALAADPTTATSTTATPTPASAAAPGTVPPTDGTTPATGPDGQPLPPTDGTVVPTDAAAEPVAAPQENPYGPIALVKNGDPVTLGALAILVLMSLGTWFVLFTKFFSQQGLFGQAKAANRALASASSVEDLAGRLSRNSPFRTIAEDGIEAAHNVPNGVAPNDWIGQALNRSVASINQHLQGGLPFLATVGSTAPFVGLFGTVMGILQALIKIGLTSQASIDKVAGPVGEALIMTAIGLLVAVPAVFCYNFLVARNKVGLEQIRDFSGAIQAALLGGSRH